MEVTAWVYAVASSSEEEDELEEDLEDLLTSNEVITSTRYLSRGDSAGQHGDHASLDGYIYEYPDDAFRRLFRMNRASFWQLVELLTNYSYMLICRKYLLFNNLIPSRLFST